MARIKVLQFVTGLALGGTERHVVNLTRGLDPSRFEVHLACLQAGGPLAYEVVGWFPISTFRIRSLLGPRTILEQRRFAAEVRKRRIDIVHTYGFYPNVFAVPAARLAGVPVVVASVRDSGDPWTRPQRLLQRIACRLAHGVLVNAASVRERLVREGYPRRRIAVIRNGVDQARFAPSGPRDERLVVTGRRLRARLGLPAEAPLVVTVSRLNPLKGVDDFLRAAALLAPRFAAARFLVVGDGPCRGELEALALRLGLEGRVVFAGARLEIAAILSQAAVSVLPSLSEALSNVLLESMAAGAPVVATRVGGTPEVIQDGRSGLLVPSCDPRTLAEAVVRILEDQVLAARLAEGGRSRILQRFTLPRMVGETAALYLSLLNEGVLRALESDAEPPPESAPSPSAALLARRRRALWDASAGSRTRRTS